jgi:endo-1,4-beta-mannosidase
LGFGLEEETGEEAAAKKKKQPVVKKEDPGKDIKLSPGNSKKVIDDLKKENIRIGDFMEKLLNQENKKGLVRSFTVQDFFSAAKAVKNNFSKKKVMGMFKVLDTEENGSLDTSELVKLWIRAKEMTDSDEILYRLLYRHLREIHYPDPLMRC